MLSGFTEPGTERNPNVDDVRPRLTQCKRHCGFLRFGILASAQTGACHFRWAKLFILTCHAMRFIEQGETIGTKLHSSHSHYSKMMMLLMLLA